MTVRAPVFREYDWDGGREWMMGFGPESAQHTLLVLPPLLEELNRTRKFLSDLMRLLADGGVASYCLDLPGTGESERELDDTAWSDWQLAAGAAARAIDAEAVVGIRGGCLLDDAVPTARKLRFAPVEGRRLMRDLVRARSLTDESFDKEAQQAVFETGPTLLGGYPLSAAMASALRDAMPAGAADVMTIRLEGDHGAADRHVDGSPLWRRAEPSGSPEMAAALAAQIADWTAV